MQLSVCRPNQDLYLSAKIIELMKNPVYDLDVLFHGFSYLVVKGDDMTINKFIERVRKHTTNHKSLILCDAVERQLKELNLWEK